MNVQEVFDKVIAAGYYEKQKLMCFALSAALAESLISEEEFKQATAEIKGYLGAWGSLGGMLLHSNLDSAFEARLAIYKDWVNRPVIKGGKNENSCKK